MTLPESHVVLLNLTLESIRISFVCPLCWTAMSSICFTFCTITLHYTALHFLHSVPISKPCVEEVQVLLDNFVKLLPSLYVLKNVHTTPMLNSTSLSKSSWPWFLSTYFWFCIWSIHRSPYKSVLWNKGTPKANGGKTRSKPNLQGACFTEMHMCFYCLLFLPLFFGWSFN